MTITVVTTRDYNGAPSTREVLRDGVRYTVVSGDLEISSSAPEVLAFYSSGNWLSVYVGDCVTVYPNGSKPELSGGVGAPPDADVAEDAEIPLRPEPDPHRPPRVAAFGSTPETTRPSGMRPVVFRAKPYRPKERDPDPPQHRWMRPVVFRAKAYKPKDRDPEPTPHNRWMRPVIIRRRTYAPERDDPRTPRPDR